MLKRCLSCLPLLVVLMAPLPAAAQDKVQAKQPALVVRIKSLDSLFDTLRVLGTPLLKKDVAAELDELIKAKLGPNGLEGIDAKRPIALYGKIDADLTKVAAVLMVPVTDEAKFLATLDSLGAKAEKDATGLYTLKQNQIPVDLFLRFANNYAYVALLDAEAIDKGRLLEPREAFPKEMTGPASLTVRIDQVPENVKQMLLEKLVEGWQDGAGKQKGKTSKAQQEFQEMLTQELVRYLRAAANEGKELTVELDVDKKAQTLRVDLLFTALPDTELAKTIGKIGAQRSLFGGLMHKDAALNALLHFSLSDKLRAKLIAVVDEGAKKAEAEIKDEGKKVQLGKLFAALLPSVEAGELDLAFSLRGPTLGRYTLVGGVKLQKADQLMKTLFEILKELPATEQKLLQFNADKAGGVAIHRLDLQKSFDAKTKEMFGDNPLYFAFRKDAAYLALGDDGLKAIKEAVQAPATTGPSVLLEMSLGRMLQVMAKTDEERQRADKVLKSGKGDRLRVTVDGGDTLRVRLEMNLAVIEAFAQSGGLVPPAKKDEKKDLEQPE
jgi:hypothetical protein